MSGRKPAREAYDVELDLGGDPHGSGCFAFALIKLTYRINVQKGTLEPMPAVALENDFRNDNLSPRLPPHSDFWPYKKFTDVGVIGSAYTPKDHAVEKMMAGIKIGGQKRQIMVLGDRVVQFDKGGRPRLTRPSAFEQMPMSIDRAYGGCDFRVPFDKKDPRSLCVTLDCDFPGLYPRNPWGTGYLVLPDPIEGMKLPNLEDPEDMLTDESIITGDPAEWYQQPMPAYLDWMPVNCFPRNLFLAIECDPWFPPPDDRRLKEVQRGFLPNGFREHLKDQHFGMPPHLRFRQESSSGLMMKEDLLNSEVRIRGMHPKHAEMVFRFPGAHPSVEMKIENQREQLQPGLTAVTIYPDQEMVCMTYTASMTSPRPFIPGIHKHIPVAVSINGDSAVKYRPPDTVNDRLIAAKAKQQQSEARAK